jgi:hypothetical protein
MYPAEATSRWELLYAILCKLNRILDTKACCVCVGVLDKYIGLCIDEVYWGSALVTNNGI